MRWLRVSAMWSVADWCIPLDSLCKDEGEQLCTLDTLRRELLTQSFAE